EPRSAKPAAAIQTAITTMPRSWPGFITDLSLAVLQIGDAAVQAEQIEKQPDPDDERDDEQTVMNGKIEESVHQFILPWRGRRGYLPLAAVRSSRREAGAGTSR